MSHRMVGGKAYEAFIFAPSKDAIAALRMAGVKCRKIGDDLYVFVEHMRQARSVMNTVWKAKGQPDRFED